MESQSALCRGYEYEVQSRCDSALMKYLNPETMSSRFEYKNLASKPNQFTKRSSLQNQPIRNKVTSINVKKLNGIEASLNKEKSMQILKNEVRYFILLSYFLNIRIKSFIFY